MDQGCILEEKIVQTTRLLFTMLNLTISLKFKNTMVKQTYLLQLSSVISFP